MPEYAHRHPGLDPGSIFIRKRKMWIPGQAQYDNSVGMTLVDVPAELIIRRKLLCQACSRTE